VPLATTSVSGVLPRRQRLCPSVFARRVGECGIIDIAVLNGSITNASLGFRI